MIDDRDLGELPTIPPGILSEGRHRAPSRAADLAADLAIGGILGIALFCAAVLISWAFGA